MAFDFDSASQYYSKEEIIKHLKETKAVDFDFQAAEKSGVSTEAIYDYLYKANTKSTMDGEFKRQVEEAPTINNLAPEGDQVVPAGPPEEDLPEGSVSVGAMEVTPESTNIPKAISEDSTTTQPSAVMYNQEGKATNVMAPELQQAQEVVPQQAQEAITKAGGVGSYVDPTTGETKQVVEAGAEPEIPGLVGTRIGMFGGPGMLGESAAKILATHEVPRAVDLAKGVVDDLVARGGLFKDLAETKGALSREAGYILARNPNLTEKQVLETLQGVKTADQAYALSRMIGDTNYVTKAVRAEGDAAAGLVRADLETARGRVLQSVGTVDIARAKAQYSDMVDTIAQDHTSVHNASGMLKDLDFLERFYGVTPSTGNRVVTQMKAVLGQNPNISLSDALEFRADLNHLINKASRGREKVKLNSIKENLDGFISSVATPEQKIVIDEAISNYSRTMQNRDVLDLIDKNTKDGIAVNWTKLHRDLNDANLRSPEAVDALRIAEAFSKRFGNDKKLLAAATPQGSNPDAGGVMGAWGYVVNHLKDALAIYGNRAENLRIQKAIMKSLRNGRTNLDFVDNLKANPDVPEEVTKIFEDLKEVAPKGPDIPPQGPKGGEPIPKADISQPLSENQGLQEAIDNIPTKPNNATERSVADTITNDRPSRTGINMLNPTKEQLSARISEIANTPLENRPAALEEELQNLVRLRRSLTNESNPAQSINIAETLTGSTRRRHLDRISDHWDDLNLHEMEGYPFKQSFDELDLSNANVYNTTEAWLNKNGTSIRELLQVQEENIAREGSTNLTKSLIEALQTGDKVYPDLSEKEVKAVVSTFPRSIQNEFRQAEQRLQKALQNDKEDLQPYHERLEAALNKGVNSRQPETVTSVPKPSVEQAQQKFDTIVRDIRRLERVPAGQRTPEQSAQLAEMRTARLVARGNIERATNGGDRASTLLTSLRNSEHSVDIADRGSGSYTIEFNGNRVSATVRPNNTVAINTTGFREGSGQGAKFYKEFYKALDAAGLKHNITSLTSVNTMRLPINIYKHKLDTGNLPIAGGQQKLQALMSNAIRKINIIAGRDIKNMTDGQLEELATRTGPMREVHAGIGSLQLYRKAARLLGSGRALSVVALAPLINAAYEEDKD